MAKRDFYPTGATCWQGGSCTRRGITRRHRYITGGDGRKFESCPYTDDWYALGDTFDTFGNPYRYRITGEQARVLTQFCKDNLEQEKN
ncbi:hypothetical protein EA160_15665 [Klebsiella pneumoniae]|uniref:Uncharacterized protein n=1 Tax=Klebsiella pneumoniae TaxID=573 RepID=A0A6M6A0N3_KLEPN|nr:MULTISPECIES: hypothetical protein [Enterobacteriaceae]QAA75307.1 hypothetical protein D4N21_27990 [Klebsiella variicola]QJX12100.1 hypothetical protein [Klebsiella pneumoniae]RLZ87504.1 hypothetical protein EA160_15665 [Klebsiella pneumoniae]UOL51911.1 hypothetical protein NDJJOOAI_00385 [Escherichia coli]HBY6861688.1 hypothetical protein [Klebsiella pneumoniae]